MLINLYLNMLINMVK